MGHAYIAEFNRLLTEHGSQQPNSTQCIDWFLGGMNDAGVPGRLLLSSGKGVALVYLTAPASVLRLWLVVCG